MKRMACVLALATGSGITLGVGSHPTLAQTSAVATNGFNISIASNTTATDDGAVPLEVNFRGGNVSRIQLSIDGAQVNNRVLNTRRAQGKIRFEVDPTLLSSGDHDVLIEATDRDGHIATATVHMHVAAVDTGGLAHLVSPRKNSMVQGIVPIEIKVDDSVRHPFVSFFVDQEFSMLNFAPFTYNWDTTRAANGPHTISIEVMDGETQEILRKLSVLVNVNNPGGLTSRQSSIRDLSQAEAVAQKPTRSLVNTLHEVGKIAAPSAHFDASRPAAGFAGPIRTATELPGALHTGVPSVGLGPLVNILHATAPAAKTSPAPLVAAAVNGGSPGTVAAINGASPGTAAAISSALPRTAVAEIGTALREAAAVNGAAPRATAGVTHENVASIGRPDSVVPPVHLTPAVVSRPGVMGLLANARERLALDLDGLTNGPAVHTPLRSRRVGNIASMPQIELGGVATHSSGMDAVQSPHTRLRAHSGVPLTPGSPVVVDSRGTFQVAFDNSQIAFDVPPRVEHGLPLAPFRQIFEHTGGTVKWYGQSHTVHAYNATREVEFKVGNRSAIVNNHPVKMDAKTYIDRGRSIVPLTFVRDALNVSVQYDPATGHMRIDSRH